MIVKYVAKFYTQFREVRVCLDVRVHAAFHI